MHPLKTLTVRGYKSIRDAAVDLRPLNVLIGANGSGKSNLTSAFTFLNQIVDRHLQLYVGTAGGPDILLHFGQKATRQLLLKVEFPRTAYECTLVPSRDTLIFSSESCFGQGRQYDRPFDVPLGQGHRESQLREEAKRPNAPVASYTLARISGWRVYHFHDTGDSSAMKQSCEINDNVALRPDASNLAAFLFLLRERYGSHYRNIVETIRQAAPFFEDFTLAPSRLNPSRIDLEWRERDSDAFFNAHSLSDGTLRFICLATLLQQPVQLMPSTIVVDEPELGLHPYAISLLASLLQSAATQTQVVVSTQSVPLVNQFAPEDLIVVEREGRESVFRRLEEAEVERWMDEYGLGDLWEKNVIGGRPR